jgi:hypothetical protein
LISTTGKKKIKKLKVHFIPQHPKEKERISQCGVHLQPSYLNTPCKREILVRGVREEKEDREFWRGRKRNDHLQTGNPSCLMWRIWRE